MAEAPSINCDCGVPAKIATTKMDNPKNPGKPFFTCAVRSENWKPGVPEEELEGCKFFSWATQATGPTRNKRKRTTSQNSPTQGGESDRKDGTDPVAKKQKVNYNLYTAKSEIEALRAQISELTERHVKFEKDLSELACELVRVTST